jgi:hypothetical protein
MIEGKTEKETIELTMQILGIDEERARFIIAQERGEIEGDEIALEPGEPLPE